MLGNAESLTEERVDKVLNEYLKDFKEGSLETKGWPRYMSAYIISKAATNAYTRIVAKKFPSFRVNCLCPGYVKTDINHNTGYLTTDEGAKRVVKIALLPNDGPSGLFFSQNEVTTFDWDYSFLPLLKDINTNKSILFLELFTFYILNLNLIGYLKANV